MNRIKLSSRKSDQPNRGFTIIELMIAMAIMAFGVLSYTFLQSRALQNRVYAREMNRATVIAQDYMEQIMSLPYTHALLTSSDHPTSGNGVTRDGKQWFLTTEGNFNYYTRWEVTTGLPTTDIKLIELFTVWDKKSSDDSSISLGGYKKHDGTINHKLTLRSFMRNH